MKFKNTVNFREPVIFNAAELLASKLSFKWPGLPWERKMFPSVSNLIHFLINFLIHEFLKFYWGKISVSIK